MAEQILQFIERRFALLFGLMIAIQVMVFVAFVLLGVVIIGIGAANIDVSPGLNEACFRLPFVFLLTLITAVSYTKLQGRKWAKWLLILTVIVNVIFDVQLAMLLLF